MYKSVKDIAGELTQKQSAPPKERGGPKAVGPRRGGKPPGLAGEGAASGPARAPPGSARGS